MTTRKASARRVEPEISNAGATPKDNQGSPQGQAPQGDPSFDQSSAMTDGEIRTSFINLAQSMTTQPQALAI